MQHPDEADVAAHFRLFHALAATIAPHENVFCSTASLRSALCAAALGATPDSATLQQMLSVFGSPAPTLEDAVAATHAALLAAKDSGVAAANALVVSESSAVREDFPALLHTKLGAELLRVRSAAEVNDWCASKTAGRIAHIIDDDAVNETTAMILINTVRFDGKWRYPFTDSYTRQWHTCDGAATPATFMWGSFLYLRAGMLRLKPVGGGADASAHVVCMQYDDGAESCEAWFVLPVNPGAAALAAVGAALPALWQDINALRHEHVIVFCPRFRIETGVMDVSTALHALDVTAPFEAAGGFGVASPNPELRISAVVHRAMCAVDEAGTVAAAASAVLCEDGDCSDDDGAKGSAPYVVDLCRPFWMTIVRRAETRAGSSATPLFIGCVKTLADSF